KNVGSSVFLKERMMYNDLVDSGEPPTYEAVDFLIVHETEGHGWGLAKTRVDFWRRVEKFLRQHIGGSAH
ncbi:MAG: hypothetical protein ACXWC2_22580, partial [Ramlibacter sp.]